MRLCCATKGCAHVIDRPAHTRGFLIAFCEKCGRTTDHFPQPATKPPTPTHGHLNRVLARRMDAFGIVLFLVSCAGARLRRAQGVTMEQALCVESRHAIVVVSGRDARGHYENALCPLHRVRPDARCVKFHCPTGHDYETRNETLNP